MDPESQLLADLDAEIARLKTLITDLANALDYFNTHGQWRLLLQRAREATK